MLPPVAQHMYLQPPTQHLPIKEYLHEKRRDAP